MRSSITFDSEFRNQISECTVASPKVLVFFGANECNKHALVTPANQVLHIYLPNLKALLLYDGHQRLRDTRQDHTHPVYMTSMFRQQTFRAAC